MPPALAEPLSAVQQRWNGLPGAARMLLIAVAVIAALAAAGTYALNAWMDDYQVLFSGLSPEDAGAVVEALKQGRVPYRAAEGGQVQVPASKVHEWRMRLASQGVPSGGNVGFEIFDKNQFGLTDFSQRLNFQRALQGELARTIGQLREIQQARVHLALPAPRVFSSQDKPPSASVVLRLRPGATLRPDQVRGIVHLVTAAVEGMSPERVTVVDSAGRMLAAGQEQRLGMPSGNQTEVRVGAEQELERRIQGLLDPIVGAGRSAVRVSAIVNFDQIERTEERFDPKPLVRTETKSTESTQGATNSPVTVGAGDRAQVQMSSTTNKVQRDSEQRTYEIARTVEKTVVAPGDLKRLSVAVLLDVPVVNGNRTPRPDEEIERIKRLVGSAAGLRSDRKDELEIMQVPFDPGLNTPGDASAPAGHPETAARRLPPTFVWGGGAAGVVLLLAIVGGALMLRGRRRRAALAAVQAALASDDLPTEIPGTAPAAAMPAAPARALEEPDEPPVAINPLKLTPKLSGQDLLRERIRAAAKDHPDEMAEILRAWMVKRRPGPA